jgi:hypothetical protein
VTCRICSVAVPFASRPFCSDFVSCNARARARLGLSKSLCGLWKLRDYQRMYPKRARAA